MDRIHRLELFHVEVPLRANLHLYAACPEGVRAPYLEYPYEPPGLEPTRRDALLPEPIAISARGTISVPQALGLGVALDPAALKRWGRRFYRLTPGKLAWQTIRSKGLKAALELKRKKEASERKP